MHTSTLHTNLSSPSRISAASNAAAWALSAAARAAFASAASAPAAAGRISSCAPTLQSAHHDGRTTAAIGATNGARRHLDFALAAKMGVSGIPMDFTNSSLIGTAGACRVVLLAFVFGALAAKWVSQGQVCLTYTSARVCVSTVCVYCKPIVFQMSSCRLSSAGTGTTFGRSSLDHVAHGSSASISQLGHSVPQAMVQWYEEAARFTLAAKSGVSKHSNGF